MTGRDQAQLSLALFFDDTPPPAPASAPGALALSRDIALVMSAAVADSGLDRTEIAARMSALTGREVSVHMINAYTSPEREAHNVSLERAIAFDLATGMHALLRLYATKCGARAYIGRDALLAELGRAEVLRDELSGQIKRIKQRMEQSVAR